MTRLRRLTAGLVLSGCALLARAECRFPDAGSPPADWTMALRTLEVSDCVGTNREDTAPIARQVRDRIAAADASGAYAPMLEATGELAKFAAGHEGVGQDSAAGWGALRAALDNSARILSTARTGETRLQPIWRTLSSNPGTPLPMEGATVQLVPHLDCGPGPCPAFEDRLDMLRVVRLMAAIDAVIQRPGFEDMAKAAALRDKRWDAYRADGLHQYWWELAANSVRMRRSDCPEAVDGDGVVRRRGFCNVPTSQLILLHPDVGLAWVHGAQSKADLKGAFLVELLGYYRWNWENASAGMTGRMGMSMAAIYADRADGGRWGFGPMFHFGDFNLGVTRAGGAPWALTVNVQLAGKYFDAKQKYLDKLKNAP